MFFLVIAVSRGWVGVDARVVLGGGASAALVAAGMWLHGRRGRTEASIALVGAGIAGMFAALVVAGEVYGLIAPLLAVGISMLVGALATVLAIRWAGVAIGALGLLGALVSPVLVGAPSDVATIAMVAVASGFAMWTAISQRWEWLGIAAVLAAAAQWGMWILAGQPIGVDFAALAVFGAIGVAGTILTSRRSTVERWPVTPFALAALNACLLGALGWAALDRAAGQPLADGWLGVLAVAHLGLGLWRTPRLALSDPLRRLLLAIGVVMADVACALTVHGIGLAVVWGAAAIGFAWLGRRRIDHGSDDVLLGLGVGAHIALTLVRVLLLTLVSWPVGDGSELVQMLAVAILAASCLASGALVSTSRSDLAVGLGSIGLAAIAYLTFQGLTGSALVAAWAFEGAALSQLWRRTGDDLARYGGFSFLGLATFYASIFEAPPTALVVGASSLTGAAIALGALGLATLRIGQIEPEGTRSRKWILGAGAGTLLYLVSVAIITSFQPAGGAETTLLDLGVRQEGQVVLSACWSLIGLAALIVGLRRKEPLIRNGALALLLMTVVKVFAYDLSTLTSLYRVVSFVALGLLLLAGAFAYQRLKPPPLPDMRDLHPSQR